jgi:hypothetical protein
VLPASDALPDRVAEKIDLPGGSGFPRLYAYRRRDILPRVFSQDRIVSCSPTEALDELLNGDLRMAAFLENDQQSAVSSKQLPVIGELPPITDYRSFNSGRGQEMTDHFQQLQKHNKIREVRFPTPNRMEIDIEANVPALLITTDVYHPDWEVEVDGKPAAPVPVNYLQRGVWLPAGRHLVQWNFQPPLLRWGWAGLGLGLIGVAVILVRPRGRRRRRPEDQDRVFE